MSPIRKIMKYSYLFNFHLLAPTISLPMRLIRYIFTALPINRAKKVKPNNESDNSDLDPPISD